MNDHTPLYAKYLIRLIRPFPDFDFFFIKPFRKRAATLLHLSPGDRVLDLGCGMGGSFPYLFESVGTNGVIVGVEISPEVIINTRKRIATNQWKNIHIITDPAQTVHLNGIFDGALMFAAPDVYASPEALKNIMPHIKVSGRVVLFGAKTTDNRFGKFFNRLLKKSVSKLSFNSTPIPDQKPWELISGYLENITVEEYFFGLMFLASGNVKKKNIPPS